MLRSKATLPAESSNESNVRAEARLAAIFAKLPVEQSDNEK